MKLEPGERSPSLETDELGYPTLAIPTNATLEQNVREPSCQSTANGLPSAMLTASKSVQIDWTRINDEDKFGLSLGQRLNKLPSGLKRRKLECEIQEAVLNAEKEALEQANF